MVDPSETSAAPATVLVVYPPIDRADIAGLCERLRLLLGASRADPFPCDVGALVVPDLVTIEALARLQLTARRLGRRIRLHDVCGELLALLALMGLADVLPGEAGGPGGLFPVEPGPLDGASRVVERHREPEQREQVRDVQERVDADDLPR
ncbi:STAS domain-containing protein [Streptomyces sp. SID3343]|nr:STAS domain-containing protein [Streptomyces sp. SID3343]